MMSTPISIETRLAPTRIRRVNTQGGTIGLTARRSAYPKATSRSRPAAMRLTLGTDSHGQADPPSRRARISNEKPTPSRTLPR